MNKPTNMTAEMIRWAERSSLTTRCSSFATRCSSRGVFATR